MLSKGVPSDPLDSKEAAPQNSAPTTVPSSPSSHEHNPDGASTECEQQSEGPFISGWRKHVLTFGIWIALFLSTLETTIVSTSLVSITNTLSGFHLRDWVVTAYFITYTGFLVIYAKLGDVFGRKTMYLLGLAIFIIFSCLCGASTNIVELIIFRAFQGMGASGIYSMTIVIAPTLVPKAEFGKYIAIISTVFALASILGPILGGVVSAHGSWRWVFFLKYELPSISFGFEITISAFFIGFPFTAIVVNIPQSLQAVYGYSPQKAGIALLPLLLLSPVATAVSGYLTSSRNAPPVYVILVGCVFQLIGVGLTCLLPTLPINKAGGAHVPASQYGFEAIMGIGFGLTVSTILTLAPLVVEPADLPVMMGALTQVRVLGGTISLAVCSTLLNNHVESKLPGILDPSRVAEISESLSAIQSLPPDEQIAVRTVYAEGYNKQNILLAAFSGVAFISCLLLWEKTPRRPTAPPEEVASKS
ncbi:hypothetical protein N0V85_001189 [Neurospora sp. IMI 360204]|nr:hypothetical protein N0V85_001189 [Neurospora sp. IMI 360204]